MSESFLWRNLLCGSCVIQLHRVSGNFRIIKGLRENISWSKISRYGPSHENLMRGENVEEYGRDWCIHGCHVYHEIWEAATGAVTPWWQVYLPISAWKVKTILPVWPMFPTRCSTDGFFHFSICCNNCLGWYWGRQQTSWIRKTVSLSKNFVHEFFAVTDNHENVLAVKISQYTVWG